MMSAKDKDANKMLSTIAYEQTVFLVVRKKFIRRSSLCIRSILSIEVIFHMKLLVQRQLRSITVVSLDTQKTCRLSFAFLTYMLIIDMTYAYDIYAVRAVRNWSDPRSKTPLQTRETFVFLVLGGSSTRNQIRYNIVLLRSIYCSFTLIHMEYYSVFQIPVLCTDTPVLNCTSEFFGVAGTVLKNWGVAGKQYSSTLSFQYFTCTQCGTRYS